MSKWAMPIANSKEVLVRFILNIGADYISILVNLVRVRRNAALFCPI